MQDYRNLRVWHLTRTLSLQVIRALPPARARKVPGLRSQAIRAATSVPANLAEGCTRGRRAEFLHFVEIAVGSLNELDGHLQLARETGILSAHIYTGLEHQLVMARKLSIALARTLRARIAADDSDDTASRTRG